MADLSPLTRPPFAADHHLDGRPVLPAVEAMEYLAAYLNTGFPGLDVRRLDRVRFDKFLFLDNEGPAAVEVTVSSAGNEKIRATLSTRRRSPRAAMTRVVPHAALTAGRGGEDQPPPPLDLAAGLEGVAEAIDSETIYRELVPFGPGYRNIVATLWLSPDGALAEVGSPEGDGRRPVLGSPYPLDAAFHAACVWSQRFAGIVAFPVALASRRILAPTGMKERFWARAVPVSTAGPVLVFDLFLYDGNGDLREAVRGVEMRDVSGGRRRPPAWLWPRQDPEPPASLTAACAGLTLVDLEAVAPFARRALSPAESERLAPMAPRRARAFVAGRIALKRLARRLDARLAGLAAERLDTTRPESPRPHLPAALNLSGLHCTLSHDRRFAVAAAAARPVGIDVEAIGDRPLRVARLFLDPREQRLCAAGCMPPAQTALRAWSAKEAAAKAAGIPLAAAWRRCRVLEFGHDRSVVAFDGGGPCEALHAVIDDHLFTLLVLAG